MVTEDDIKWLAGVIDARATIRIINKKSRGKNCPTIRVSLYGPPALLQEAGRIMGRSVRMNGGRAYDRKGCAEHCEEAHVHVNMAPTAMVDLDGTRCGVIMHSVLPHMRVQRHEAAALLTSPDAQLISDHHSSAKVVEDMISDGWPSPF